MNHLVFVIGGPYGFSEEVYRRADAKLSLSRLTFSHQLVRLIFMEQLYRAFTTKFNCTMYGGYGLTEAAPAVALCRPGMPFKQGSCGVPIPGVEVSIVDREDNALPAG